MKQHTLRVAMLEDDSDDRYITQEVLASLDFDLHIEFFASSDAFFEGLKQLRPQLVLVDANAVPENGIQVLRRLKEAEATQTVPVVILGDGNHPRFRDECYAAGASAFVLKPSSLQETKDKINAFFTYWTSVAML